MKKLLLIILSISFQLAIGQVTTSPSIPIVTEGFTVIFDATGTPLDGHSGTIYAHTGATVNGEEWENVIGDWGNNTNQPSLTKTSGNLYELQITPDVFSYYAINTSDAVTKLWFVFRAADGGTQTSDLSIDVFEAGLNVTVTNPIDGSVFELNQSTTISAESSVDADLELFVDNVSQQTALNTKNIEVPFTFITKGNHEIKVVASKDGETTEHIVNTYVKSTTVNEPLPTGLSNGYNDNGDGTISFVLLAPNKTDVFLLGDFNDWELNDTYQLKKDGDYFWTTITGLDLELEYTYQYYIDFEIKIADPYALKVLDPNNDQYIPDSTYPNLIDYPTGKTTGIVSTFKINDEEYVWQHPTFAKPAQDNLVIYEMLIRDFTDSDTFNEAKTHLDYLENLGVNAIELMPVNEFEGNDSWGYNPSYYMALDKAYGTKNDFKAFVDACHARGIAVLTDVVFNHSYSQSPLLQMYWDGSKPSADSPFYNQNHNLVDNTSAHWGYDFNHESDYTVDFFKDVLDFWMEEYNIDGFRFDFTKGFSNTLYYGENNWASAYDAERIENLKNYADHVWANDPGNEPYVIFEHLSDNDEEAELANYGIMLWGNMNHSFNQNTMGFANDSDVSWLSYKNRGWNEPNVVGYMESHDEERLMVKNLTYGKSNDDYDVTVLNTALKRQEAATAIFYAVPGPKMIWQFGELGYDKSINCESDITDGSCRLDRKPDAWTLGYDQDNNRTHLFDVTAKMIELKHLYPSTFNTDDFSLDVSGLVKRINLNDNAGDLDAVVIANFDIVSKSVNPNFPLTGIWYRVFNGSKINVDNPTEAITLAPGEYRIYTTSKLNDLEFSLAHDNFNILATGETCLNKSNGEISITTKEAYSYTAAIDGQNYDFTSDFLISNLASGTYEVCITLLEEANYEQCFNITVDEAEEITGKILSSKSSKSSQTAKVQITQGTAPYTISINGKDVMNTSETYIELNVTNGDKISVSTALTCEGILEKYFPISNGVVAFPNPTSGLTRIATSTDLQEATVIVTNMQQQVLINKVYSIANGFITLDLSDKPSGFYIATILLETPVTTKLIKQ
ncbi:alpha-amylase family glycosyl hydrolase [Urechidicola vernalis]|uniref:Alpha-amylase family glycosyl hydrolase n=1 Tax=Urechidicola vernalis TaxID=3075600 RepID=A0ABU2Y332_9FLAO|nr:alpha-amylase family glycosyl hydrolase [Urechidicola sp. P050]MDT0552619.1 alpha-amylase family glycosyl hydrolase [Urechidicola sp. P050]